MDPVLAIIVIDAPVTISLPLWSQNAALCPLEHRGRGGAGGAGGALPVEGPLFITSLDL